ncbi:hypothetical protein EVA_00373 [gut metagenome]|uniref:Uncharacterized protein n=1 Tax=gut metagenome TaxID=749906 RepID=J9H8Z6_9ZZZZ
MQEKEEAAGGPAPPETMSQLLLCPVIQTRRRGGCFVKGFGEETIRYASVR